MTNITAPQQPAVPNIRSPQPKRQAGLLERIPVGQKLGLASLPLLLGLTISLGFNINDQWQEIFKDRRALVGTEYLDVAQDIFFNVQKSESVLASASVSDNQKEFAALNTQIEGLFAKLASLSEEKPFGNTLNQSIANTRKAWTDVNAKIAQGNAEGNQTEQNITFLQDFLLGDMRGLIDAIALESEMRSLQYSTTAELTNLSTSVIPRNVPESGIVWLSLERIAGSKEPLSETELGVLRQQLRGAEFSHQTVVKQAALAAQYFPAGSDALQAATTKVDEATQLALAQLRQVVETGQLSSSSRAGVQANVDASLSAQEDFYKQALANLREAISREERSLVNQALLTLLAIVLFLSVALWLTLRTANSITRPLRQLTRAAQAISRGEFEARVPIVNTDELGTLATSFNGAAEQLEANQQRVEQERLEQAQLQNNIAQFLDVTMDIAEGDLTKRGVVTAGVLGNVVDSINLMTEGLGDVLGDAQKASNSVTAGSQTMLSSTQAIEQGALQTTQAVRSVAQQTAEVNQQIQEMARIAQASAEAARQALAASQQGQDAVQATLSGMEGIRDTTRATEERIAALSERSRQIGQIVDTISNIASQTNLLSLHASIEAAGAGEAGERFSVVAEEVRQLADESAAATGQIASLVSGIQQEIASVVQMIRENAQQVNEGYQVAGTAGERLGEIGNLSRESARLAEQISESSRLQVQNIEQVSSSVQGIAQTAERSQQSVEQGRAAAQQLQQLADQLSASLSRFRLPS